MRTYRFDFIFSRFPNRVMAIKLIQKCIRNISMARNIIFIRIYLKWLNAEPDIEPGYQLLRRYIF